MKIQFNDIFVDCTSDGTKIPKESYLKSGKYIIIDQGQNQIAGFTNQEDGVYSDVPAIIFGDHTRVIKYVDEPFFLGADGVKLLKSTKKDVNYKYLYYALLSLKVLNLGYNRHFKLLKESNIEYRDINTQNSIVKILDKINSIIQKHKEVINNLDTLIKARFVEMFGDVVKNTKNWKTKKLNELCGFNNNKLGVDSIHNKVWLLNLDMIESDSGKIIDYYMIDEKEVPSSTISFNENCVLYSKLRPYLNKVVIPIKSGYATSELIAIETNSLINKYFLAFALRSKSFVDMINLTSYGAKMPRASVDALKNFYIPVPDIEIQNTFATFVKEVDKLKFDVQKSLEKSQMLFDSLIQQNFA